MRKTKKEKRVRVIKVWDQGFKKVGNYFDVSAAHIGLVLGRCVENVQALP